MDGEWWEKECNGADDKKKKEKIKRKKKKNTPEKEMFRKSLKPWKGWTEQVSGAGMFHFRDSTTKAQSPIDLKDDRREFLKPGWFQNAW